MYQSIKEQLPDFEQYEISAFARKGRRSNHNSGYWTGRPFLGLGPSAFSYLEGWRFSNVASMPAYLKAVKEGVSPVEFRERLSKEGCYREMLAVGIRLKEGVAIGNDCSEELAQELHHLQENGLIKKKEGRLHLTERGILMYDTVAEKLIL
jgi:oxygen-independent coproporphyrinogen-3 oxidase